MNMFLSIQADIKRALPSGNAVAWYYCQTVKELRDLMEQVETL